MQGFKLNFNDTKETWETLFIQASRTNYFQSWGYGIATATHSKYEAVRCVVYRKKTPVALTQCAHRSGKISLTKILRGPIWVADLTLPEKLEICQMLVRYFKNTPLESVLLLPDLPADKNMQDFFKILGAKIYQDPYHTRYMDLTVSEKKLYQNMRIRHQQSLKKGADLDVVSEKELAPLLVSYRWIQVRRFFKGPSTAFIKTLCAHQPYLHLAAYKEGKCVGRVLFVCHGLGATYVIGWSSKEGRRLCANHALIWAALMKLKAQGMTHVDMGGTRMKNAKGVTFFKEGFGGAAFTTHPMYLY